MFVWLALACASQAAPGLLPMAQVPKAAPGQEVAVVAGGCFWCVEADFDKLPGVVSTISGFAGGKELDPTYEQVANHMTSHIEAVYIVYDTKVLTYEKVLTYFYRHVDPTDPGGQFCDRGSTYRTAVFPQGADQQRVAEKVKADLGASGWLSAPIVTEILPNERFWPAEEYHQDFHHTNPGRYVPYRQGCGRDARLAQVWKAAPPMK
jgi:peptide-methionine (S)-S-oxide reductase